MLGVAEMRKLKKEDPLALDRKVKDLREQYFRLKMESKVGRVQKPHLFKDLRRELARCLTVMGESQ